MKIILASDNTALLKHGYELTGIPKSEMRIGYVVTGAKGARDGEFFEMVERTISEHGYHFEKFDIEGKSMEDIRTFFKDKNIIHVEGGNSFYLPRAIRESNFAQVLEELLEEGKVYIGTSAGAYVMCPTIEVSDWNKNGRDRFGVSDFRALHYVPFLLKAHYTDASEDLVREHLGTLAYPLRILRDGQGILVEDGTYTFFGDGEEVRL